MGGAISVVLNNPIDVRQRRPLFRRKRYFGAGAAASDLAVYDKAHSLMRQVVKTRLQSGRFQGGILACLCDVVQRDGVILESCFGLDARVSNSPAPPTPLRPALLLSETRAHRQVLALGAGLSARVPRLILSTGLQFTIVAKILTLLPS